MQPNTFLQPDPQNADNRNLALDLELERNALLFPTTSQPANDATDIKSKNVPSPRTLINEAMRQYVEVLQKAILQDSGIVVQKVTKPKIMFLRGKGWFVVRDAQSEWISIGESSERAIRYWQKKTLNLRKMLRLENEVKAEK